jgi:hypothetical protein
LGVNFFEGAGAAHKTNKENRNGGGLVSKFLHQGMEKWGRNVFVEGLAGYYSGRQYDGVLFVRKIGTYNYQTVSGANRTIPKYELGTPITKEEFVQSVNHKKP